jgi:hypothetical protein
MKRMFAADIRRVHILRLGLVVQLMLSVFHKANKRGDSCAFPE